MVIEYGATSKWKTDLFTLVDMNHHVVDSGVLSTLREVLPQLGYDLAKDALEEVVVEGGD